MMENQELDNEMDIWCCIYIWEVVKILAPFWIPIIIRHLIFRGPKKGPEF